MKAGWACAFAATLVETTAAFAQTAPASVPVAFGADELHFDAQTQALDATGHVRVDEPPFHLTSDALKLRRVPIGAELQGDGKVAFCPCLGAPLAVRFTGATVAPPHDLILRNPVLEVFGIPVAWAPILWLRSTGRLGLLPPEIAWRGADGFFAGGGVHLPWTQGDRVRGLDLRAGGYAEGGVDVDAALRTTVTMTRVRWDRLHGRDGVAIAAHGATAAEETRSADATTSTSAESMRPDDGVAWDVDALRGERAVQATTDIDAAARPFDRAAAEAAWRPDGWVIASGVRAVAPRGGDALDLGAVGPMVALRRSDGLGGFGAYDATLEGGQVSLAGTSATTFARAEGGTLLATRIGSLGTSLAVRGLGVVADDGAHEGWNGVAQARAAATLPFVRAYSSGTEETELDPWIHRTEPRVEAAVLAEHADGALAVPVGRGMLAPPARGSAWIVAAGWYNGVGRFGSRDAGEIDAVVGTVGDAANVMPVLRGRATIEHRWLGLRADVARVGTSSFFTSSRSTSIGSTAPTGGAFFGALRVGPREGPSVAAHVAERDGIDPIVARAVVDPPFEAASGFLTEVGWTGGALLAVPFGSRITTRGGAEWDFQARSLVAALGSLELHDPCNCVVLRASVAHRIGRDGVDAWLSVDLPFER